MSPLLRSICGKYRFRVEIDGIQQAGFREVEGIEVNIEAQEYREGTDPHLSFEKIPGLVRYTPIVLKSAITPNMELFNWIYQVIQGKIVKKNMAVIVVDREGNDAFRVEFNGAWPSGWRLGKPDSHSSSPLIEELTIQYDSLRRVK